MSQPIIDIGILTIREDEFRAALHAFPDNHAIYKGRHREYTLRTADAGQGSNYRLAILRQIEQGNGEAQDAARDLFEMYTHRCFWWSALLAVCRRTILALGMLCSQPVSSISASKRASSKKARRITLAAAQSQSRSRRVLRISARARWSWAIGGRSCLRSRTSAWPQASCMAPGLGSEMCGRSCKCTTVRTSGRERLYSTRGR
jgi:hypothetical protein